MQKKLLPFKIDIFSFFVFHFSLLTFCYIFFFYFSVVFFFFIVCKCLWFRWNYYFCSWITPSGVQNKLHIRSIVVHTHQNWHNGNAKQSVAKRTYARTKDRQKELGKMQWNGLCGAETIRFRITNSAKTKYKKKPIERTLGLDTSMAVVL